MHYYKRNIGDYSKKAARLTMIQHGAYTLLMDSCYDREQFPTKEEAIDWVWASSKEEIEAVEFVLNKFFTLDEDGRYIQDRIKQELEKYHKNADTNRRIAQEREQKRRQKSTNRARTVNEAPPNQEPLTINQEPLTKRQVTRIPTLDQVKAYAKEKNYTFDVEYFFNYWESAGWTRSKGQKIKNWKACMSNWQKKHAEYNSGKQEETRKRKSALEGL